MSSIIITSTTSESISSTVILIYTPVNNVHERLIAVLSLQYNYIYSSYKFHMQKWLLVIVRLTWL